MVSLEGKPKIRRYFPTFYEKPLPNTEAMAYVTRQVIIEALTAAEVEFEDDATVAELRPLYDNLLHAEEEARLRAANERERVENEQAERDRAEQALAERDRAEQAQAERERAERDRIAREGANDDDHAAERARLEQQLEIARMRNELRRLTNEVHEPSHHRVDFAEFEAMVHQFNGDDDYDVHKWIADIEDAFGVLNCSERNKFVCAPAC